MSVIWSRRAFCVRTFLLSVAAVLLAAALGCGGSKPAPTPDVQANIDSALARIAGTEWAPTPATGVQPAASPATNSVPLATPEGSPPQGTQPDVPATHPAQPTEPAVTGQAVTPTFPREPTPTTTPEPQVPFRDLRNGAYLEQRDPQSTTQIKTLPWVSDGIGRSELPSIEELVELAAFHRDIFNIVVGYAWISDGVTEAERRTVRNLRAIVQQDQRSGHAISRMPFLQDWEPADGVSVWSLRRLAFDDPRTLQRILSHSSLAGGLTDDWAKIVAVFGGTNQVNPGLIDALLDPNRVAIEERLVDLPLAGRVNLVIISTAAGATRSMDLLEHSVRRAEEFMAEPFPTNFVAVLFENAVLGSASGTNFGTHIAILPEFDADDGGREAEAAGHVIAHEVAHYYWSGNEDWVDEGASEFLASVSERSRTGKDIEATNPPCAVARNIDALERFDTERNLDAFFCNYSLGERIFADLYRSMDEAGFRRGFRNLYLMSEAEDDADDLRGTPVGINQLSAVFRSPNDATTVDRVVGRWYHGTVAFDTSGRDASVPNPNLAEINGRIDDVYISTSQNGAPITGFSASNLNAIVWLNLQYSFLLTSGSGTIELEVVEYYEDGFESSRRRSTLNADPRHIGGTQWYSVGPLPPQRWAPGRHWVYVYESGRKVAEVEFLVTP